MQEWLTSLTAGMNWQDAAAQVGFDLTNWRGVATAIGYLGVALWLVYQSCKQGVRAVRATASGTAAALAWTWRKRPLQRRAYRPGPVAAEALVALEDAAPRWQDAGAADATWPHGDLYALGTHFDFRFGRLYKVTGGGENARVDDATDVMSRADVRALEDRCKAVIRWCEKIDRDRRENQAAHDIRAARLKLSRAVRSDDADDVDGGDAIPEHGRVETLRIHADLVGGVGVAGTGTPPVPAADDEAQPAQATGNRKPTLPPAGGLSGASAANPAPKKGG